MIGVIDYGMGNLGSILRMLKKIGAAAKMIDSPTALDEAERFILPGVGAFDTAMSRLENKGFREPLSVRVLQQQRPVLGICLGMQLLFEKSEEGIAPGFGWLPGDVRRFRFESADSTFQIPHMGWNTVRVARGNTSPLFESVDDEPRFYFVHSYHAVPACKSTVAATADYGYEFCCAVARGNIMGVQFHPEKSHRFGLRLLERFATQSTSAALT